MSRRTYLGPMYPAIGPDFRENPYKFGSEYWPETHMRNKRHDALLAKIDDLMQQIDRSDWRRERQTRPGGVVRL